MVKKRNIVIISACLCLLGGLGFIEKRLARFTIPNGWPQPQYDFSKNPLTDEGFRLGRVLFYDPILSRDSSTSCSSCHIQFSGFSHGDHRVSHGINGLKGTRNPMVLFNLAWYKSFRWDGAANHIETQPIGPITNPIEMDNTMEAVVKKLQRSARYQRLFKEAFGDTVVTTARTMKAMAQYLLCLQSFDSKYDKVMRKEDGVTFTENEEKGYRFFKMKCANCHSEPLFTSQQFIDNGLAIDTIYMDAGRGGVTQQPKDSFCFRVPTLRNIAVSSPYMHDGRFQSLEEVLLHYQSGVKVRQQVHSSLKKGIPMTPVQQADLLAFLNTLTDKNFLYELRYRYHLKD
jgi:cytochrome c peroxidase